MWFIGVDRKAVINSRSVLRKHFNFYLCYKATSQRPLLFYASFSSQRLKHEGFNMAPAVKAHLPVETRLTTSYSQEASFKPSDSFYT